MHLKHMLHAMAAAAARLSRAMHMPRAPGAQNLPEALTRGTYQHILPDLPWTLYVRDGAGDRRFWMAEATASVQKASGKR